MPKFVSDSRLFTDWRPNCQMNIAIQEKYRITDTKQYKKFLQEKSDLIIKDNNDHVFDNSNCPVCNEALAL